MARTQKLIILSIVVFCVLCLAFISNTNVAYAYDLFDENETNSVSNPYLITSALDMDDLSAQVEGGNLMEGRYFLLNQNITLSANFEPIGDFDKQFKGYFDGNNFTITVSISTNGIYNGIFGAVGSTGTITNLRVAGSITGGETTGSIAGYNVGLIDNCINYASIQAYSTTIQAVGGIVGINYGTVTDCINNGTVIGNNYIGGIAGKNMTTGNSASTISGVINLGNLSALVGANSYIIGGLVGQNDAIVKNGYNYSLISNNGDSIGSIIGYFGTTASLSGSKYCYNNTAKSSISVVGTNAQSSLPATYTAYSMYDFLGRTALVFESSVMSVHAFDAGYGYFPMLNQFVNESAISDYVRHSIFNSGDGTQSSPFIINNASQWELFATNTLIHDYSGIYVQLNTSIAQSTPLSNFDNPFNGIFDGNNKTITLSISGTDFAGMFRYIGTGGIVKNLTMAGWVSLSGNYAGSVAGYLSGSIQNVTTSARIVANSYAGGLAGEVYNSGSVNNFVNVKNSGSIEGINSLGGIAGYAYNLITSGYIVNSGAVQGSNITSGSKFGGIIGQVENSSLITYTAWLNSGVVNATKGEYAGGLAGSVTNGVIAGSMNIGALTGSIYVGGIAGYINGGNLESVGVVNNITGANYTGGIVGFFGADASITDSYFSGKFYKLSKSTIVSENFRTIAYSAYNLTLTKVYYNSDLIDAEGITDSSLLIPSVQSEGASYIQLTDVNGSVHTVNFDSTTYWTISAMTLSYGYYPIAKNFDTATTLIISNAVKYTYFNSGNGTSLTPFTVNKAQQLYNLSYLHNNYSGYASLYYQQTANITLDATFTPIGNDTKVFSGNYDGQYYTIGNLIISNTTDNYTGLFGMLSSATINRVALISGSVSGNYYAGSICGYAVSSSITNSYSLINVEALASGYAGGILGYSEASSVYGCFNAGRVNVNGNFGGGILGYGNATTFISKSFNTGMITGTNAVTGGIIGSNNGGDVSACYNSGTVKVTTDNYAGGLAGSSIGTIQNCYSIAKVIYVTATKSGALAGQVNASVTNYLNSCYYNSDICTLYPHSGTTTTTFTARTTAQMETSSGDNNFVNSFTDNTLYTFNLSASKDSHYAPRLSIFVNSGNANIESYSALSVRLRLFGWNDDSNETWGTVNNPYIISTRAQLVTLSLLTSTYTYSGCYFVMANDIDMRVGGYTSNFSPIGTYTDAQNYHAFDGVFDGQGHTLLYLYISSVGNYVGLFGLIGANASIKNLIIDENSQITTTGNYVGSIVGRNMSENGVIDRCVSYATVSGINNVGGLVGYTYNNTEITNCLFDGIISGTTYVYGIVGIATNASSNVTTTNSWYIFRYDPLDNENEYLVSRDEGYLNNGYSSTLFVDKNGAVIITIDTGAENAQFITFTLTPDSYYTGYYMDSNNNIVSSDYTFYAINNTTLTSMYARFTLPVSTNITGEENINVTGAGNYYSGQTVTLKATFVNYGYFINIFDFVGGTIKSEYADYTLSNDGEQIWITFTMPHSFTELSEGKVVNIELLTTNTYITLTANGNEYSGNDNNAQITVESAGAEYFDNIELIYFYGEQKTRTTATVNAGSYEVRARLAVDESFGLTEGLFLGIQSATYTVTAKELTGSASWDWTGLLGKEYDGTNYKNSVIVTNNIEGIIASDLAYVSVYSTITWSSSDAGTGLDLTASAFTIGGSYSDNYFISGSIVISATGSGYITAKTVTVTIASSSLSHTYNNSKPSITNITVSGSLGSVDLIYTFALVDAEGTPVASWNNTWNVGRYSIAISTTNTNYEVSLSTAYYLNIIPIVISSVTYSGYNNLTYTANNLAGSIYGTYSTLYSGTDNVTLTYYYYLEPLVGLTTVINAGSYTAVPAVNIAVSNYVLSASVNTLTFNVSRATRAESLGISLGVAESTVGDSDLPLTIVNGNSDGTLTLNKVVAKDRGELLLINSSGSYSVSMTAYGSITFTVTESGCQNYNDRTSSSVTLVINPKAIYIGVANRSWYYGDDIVLELQYSWDIGQTEILTTQTLAAISNFVSPAYYLTASELNASATDYEVKILGAQSDGYRFYTANTNYITIEKRPIEIIVSDETSVNSKTYGDSDLIINYTVKDKVNNTLIANLPNGDNLDISGVLAREAGENVGAYAINRGTISDEANPNYILTFSTVGSYIITRKAIKLVMPSYTKKYLENDPVLLPILYTGYSYVGTDNINSINVPITRVAGESIGSYNYILGEYDGRTNYSIISVEINTKFYITYAIPVISILSIGTVSYGNTLSTASIYGSASNLGQNIEGIFRWSAGSTIVNSMTFNAQAVFIPSDSNVSSATINVTVPVAKRKISVTYSGNFDYTYTGLAIVKNYSLTPGNYIAGTVPVVQGSINTVTVNVGEYIITPALTNDCNGVYELASDVDTATLRIYPAVISVTVDGGEITFGDNYIPVITYSGLVNGETENVISTKAAIGTVPTAVGYYTITPSGAASDNYSFTYFSSSLVIVKTSVSTETVTLTGKLAPEVNVETTVVTLTSVEATEISGSIDSVAGASLFKPNNSEMVEYIKFEITGSLADTTEYEVQISSAIVSGSTIYLINADGSIELLEDYTVNDAGKLVFNAGNINGIGIFNKKEILTVILDYLPLVGMGLGIVGFIILVIYLTKLSHRVEQARRKKRLR